MQKRWQIVIPKCYQLLKEVGENIKLARKRRNLTVFQVANRAGVTRFTVSSIERGNPGVAIGAYFDVLRVLGSQEDVLKLAVDDQYDRK